MESKLVVILAVAIAIASASTAPQELPTTERLMTPCMGTRTYMLEVNFEWSGMTHPDAYVMGGHFSPLVAAAHNDGYQMWAPMDYSTMGVQTVAETGNPSYILEELRALKGRKVFSMNSESGPTASGVETVRLRLKVRDTRTLISAISMVAPSPDWFTGLSNMNVCDEANGEWLSSLAGNLGVYDAGTDRGMSFMADDKPNRRMQPITMITDSIFGGMYVGTYMLRMV